MKNKQYVILSCTLMLCSMTSQAMENEPSIVPSYSNVLDNSHIEWNAFKSVPNDISEEEPQAPKIESSDSESTNSSGSFLGRISNFAGFRNSNSPSSENDSKKENDSKNETKQPGYLGGFYRLFLKSTSWDLPMQMIGARRDNLEELDKTISLLTTMNDILNSKGQLKPEELKQYNDRISYANQIGLMLTQKLNNSANEDNNVDRNEIDAKELGERLTTLHEANNTIRFHRSGYQFLTPWVQGHLEKARKQEKKNLQPIVKAKKDIMQLLASDLQTAADDSDIEE